MARSTFLQNLSRFNRDDAGRAPAAGAWLLAAATLAAALALSGCAGYQPGYSPGPRPVSFAECQSQVQRGDHFECVGSPAAVQVAASVPPPAPVAPRPQRTAAIEYVDGRPMVRVAVPGVVSFRCLLDTGADDLVIPFWAIKEFSEKYGFGEKDAPILDSGQASLANGDTIRIVHLMLHQLTIGSWKLTNVPVSVTFGMGDCLLGMSVLKAFGHPMIDFANQRLILED